MNTTIAGVDFTESLRQLEELTIHVHDYEPQFWYKHGIRLDHTGENKCESCGDVQLSSTII